MTRKTSILAAVALILTVGVGLWMWEQRSGNVVATPAEELPYGYDPSVPATSVDEVKLRALAIASCECERSDKSKSWCWLKYKAATARFSISSAATACAPISTEMDCIATDEGEKCIVTGYGIAGVCTPQEAAAVESAYYSAFDRVTGGHDDYDDTTLRKAGDAANEAVDAIVERIRRGESIAVPNSDGGCAS